MSILNAILQHNRQFVANKEYEAFLTTKFPDKRLVVVTCMDTRLEELLPRAMNLRQGDVKLIRTAGAVISHPYGSIMRSILIALYLLNAREVCIVGHHDCGMTGLQAREIVERAHRRGVPAEKFAQLSEAGIDVDGWLSGFSSVHASVIQGVTMVRTHPLLPPGIAVHGLVIDPVTGELELVVDGRSPTDKEASEGLVMG